jgi:hypothetical protein
MYIEAGYQIPGSVLPPNLHTLRLRPERSRSQADFNSFLRSGIVLQQLPWCSATLRGIVEAAEEAREGGSSAMKRLVVSKRTVDEVLRRQEEEDV